MTTADRSGFTEAETRALAKAAKLPVADDRLAGLGATAAAILTLLDTLDTVALGETSPAFGYRARSADALAEGERRG